MMPEIQTNHTDAPKPKARKTTGVKRSRALKVEVTLTGPVASWVKTEAAKNYRDHAGQIAYVLEQMRNIGEVPPKGGFGNGD